ncbi:GNAT family N-acetyltransferase [Paraburkholderia megapolitana]|uniref:Acetyltransferase (GNAT) family protein n=1 Tax=Paraburkholderia megapolitana TaxID=420953 RepID=A0A1I3LGA1_9BURK|nr:GNAT family N-acetyltransferase [Paraburkholderia megapolitana]QDQ80710.1 GNAT family N-acetyltransferase [Paraburkholderia megapolitana]SFI83792.1 Acetyltransferase (GNAT) family protein [Paraburkholderia megapolitana]
MTAPLVAVADTYDAEFDALLGEGLDRFNIDTTGIDDKRPLTVRVTDPTTGEVGGITGRTSLGVLFIDLFYLPPALRGSGIGSTLLARAEEEGRRRGCHTGFLYTISFQAPDFYARYGWRAFGDIASNPPGTRRMFMTKSLNDA